MSEQQEDLQVWRNKYYDTLGELETREEQWQQVEQVLRQGLNRLTLVADDSDPKLNQQLDSLRDALREGSPASKLKRSVEAVSDTILGLDEARKERQEEERGEVLGKLIAGEEEEKAAPQEGLTTARRLLDELIHALVGEPKQREKLSDRLRDSRQEEQLLTLGRELAELLQGMGDEESNCLPVNEVLVRLLERLDIPAELGREVEKVKAMLLGGLGGAKVDLVIVSIANLVAEMRRRMQGEKAETEAFLKQLTDRLQEIDSGFQLNMESRRESYREGQALDEAVHTQMSDIEESVHQAEELDALKAQVQQRVDTIRRHMQEFRRKEDHRLKQAEEQVRDLSERLVTVRSESDTLRRNLREERNQAMIDPLTGIPNRLAYNERLQQEEARWKRYGSALSVVIWDVDKFKRVNDTYGHQAGDKVLTVIGKVLHRQSRETDFVARFGGEEFVMLMPETSADKAMAAAEKLRQAVGAAEFHFRGSRVEITISCGISEFRRGDSGDKVFERADKALYEAKHSGRNRCCKG